MTPSKVVLLSVLLSVLASVLAMALLFPKAGDQARAPQQVVESHAGAPPAGGWFPVTAEPNAEAIVQLQEKVRGIEQKLATGGRAPPVRAKEAALEALLGITQGERQIAIEDSLEELTALGNEVVPDIVALLKSGRDQDYGGSFSYGGNKVSGYPRLRTVMIDVLRQIGTAEAQEGILDVLHASEDPLDYRDVFLLYATTTDERMERGMSAMVPDALRMAKGQERGLTMHCVTEWVSRHDLKDTADLLEEMARENLASGAYDRETFATLVGLAPERAFDLTRELRERGGEGALSRAFSSAVRSKAPLAQVARYYELVLSLDLSESSRISLYSSIPTSPCRIIQSNEARTADAMVLLDFLTKRLRDETGPKAKLVLEHYLATLQGSVRG
jgi:hypothetical protein